MSCYPKMVETCSNFNMKLYTTINKLNTKREPPPSNDEQIASLITLSNALDHVISTKPLQLARPTKQLGAILTICTNQIDWIFRNKLQETPKTRQIVNLIVNLLKRIGQIQNLFVAHISEKSITKLLDSVLNLRGQEYSKLQIFAQIRVLFIPFKPFSLDPSLILLALVTLLNKWTDVLVHYPQESLDSARKINFLTEMLPESVFYFVQKDLTPGYLPNLFNKIHHLLMHYSTQGARLMDHNLNALSFVKSLLDFLARKEGNQLWNSFTIIELSHNFCYFNYNYELLKNGLESSGKFKPLVRMLAARGLTPPERLLFDDISIGIVEEFRNERKRQKAKTDSLMHSKYFPPFFVCFLFTLHFAFILFMTNYG